MNWNQFRKNIGWRFQLAPAAYSIDPLGNDIAVPEFDDWIFDEMNDKESIRLRRIWSGHVAILGKDHIFDFRSDPSRSSDGLSYGFLVLKMQVVILGSDVRYVPNAKPGEHAHFRRPVHAARAPAPAPTQSANLRGYTKATVPNASAHRGEFILVTHPVHWDRAMLCYSDGHSWLSVQSNELP